MGRSYSPFIKRGYKEIPAAQGSLVEVSLKDEGGSLHEDDAVGEPVLSRELETRQFFHSPVYFSPARYRAFIPSQAITPVCIVRGWKIPSGADGARFCFDSHTHALKFRMRTGLLVSGPFVRAVSKKERRYILPASPCQTGNFFHPPPPCIHFIALSSKFLLPTLGRVFVARS